MYQNIKNKSINFASESFFYFILVSMFRHPNFIE